MTDSEAAALRKRHADIFADGQPSPESMAEAKQISEKLTSYDRAQKQLVDNLMAGKEPLSIEAVASTTSQSDVAALSTAAVAAAPNLGQCIAEQWLMLMAASCPSGRLLEAAATCDADAKSSLAAGNLFLSDLNLELKAIIHAELASRNRPSRRK